jgi:hypothetical protein
MGRGSRMCKFFSVVSDGAGKAYYFDYSVRKRIIAGELTYETDSHTSIADSYGFKGNDEDMLNKYEYNPLTKEFKIDGMPNKDDSKIVHEFCKNLDFKTIVPELVIKPIIHSLRDVFAGEVTDREIELLKQWGSVRDSVRGSVRGLVWDSVRDSVGGSVWDSVWDSVGGLVWASVGGYISSFFNLQKWKYTEHEEGKNPFQSCIDLWESGFVPSFDGKTWRLHAGKNAKIVYEAIDGEGK